MTQSHTSKNQALLEVTETELKQLRFIWVTRKFTNPAVLARLKLIIQNLERELLIAGIWTETPLFRKH